jgi:hypothetical protein
VTLNGSSRIDGNSASFGGGVDSTLAQTAALTLNDNSSIGGNSAHEGGGVENLASGAGASATVTLTGTSSIDGSTVATTFGGYGAGRQRCKQRRHHFGDAQRHQPDCRQYRARHGKQRRARRGHPQLGHCDRHRGRLVPLGERVDYR